MKKFVLFIALVLTVLSLIGCSKSDGSGAGGLKDEKIENYSVKIVYDGKNVKTYTIEDIKKMPVTSFESEGAKEEGPDVLYILSQNNITEYSKIKFIGMWKDSITLTKEEASKDTLVDITNHDTIKLATKSVKKDKWIKDISTIEIIK
ncbi:MAG: hypothetical protein LIR50_06540 [Bacillota bacterium]|nr:hypothetical protein [Bacillota bacterium]